ncbi:iron-hydroxamate ABC transporter substrate-binding protein [Paenibacillus sp. PAMC21692]|uniref:iron-hydroxamate ABC transporter substrate-binding protein n=1 Tax=Paenibacillus sp. PAMC21692 TaxID=2762320 RepID=UPI00164E9931|nr:iron-hydroxamate ABC transporter substrate-binding protein [Paenibacillus sp. PAMC21692]QNK58797.1 iron-hydroxamate ABC transporter substrate-binding protein [Paenibacillus sp. PAMC21692]
MNVRKTKRSTSTLAGILLLSLLLAACGSANNDNGADNGAEPTATTAATDAPTASGQPTEFKLTDGLGHEVTIPAQPKRVIASYLEDYLVALDVKPVAQWSVPNGTQAYLQEYLADIPAIPHDLPYEAVLSFDPDLIITGMASTVEGDKYNQYSQIAPTFTLGDEVNGDWRQALLKVGEVLGKAEQAQQVLADYETKAAEAKATIQSKAAGQSAAALWLTGNNFFVVSDTQSSGAVLYGELGLEVPATVKEIADASEFSWNSISLEKLAQLDADHIFLINSDGDGAEALKDPVWQGIPAVKNGNIHEFGADTSWLYTGPIANGQMIDNVLASVVK